jgi:hypothetical protein
VFEVNSSCDPTILLRVPKNTWRLNDHIDGATTSAGIVIAATPRAFMLFLGHDEYSWKLF